MQGFPLIPRAEMRLWRAGRGSSLILKDEWRLNQRSLSFFLSPPRAPRTPAPLPCILTPHPYPASLPPRLHLYMHAKSPRLLPHLGGEAGGFHRLSVTALSVTALSQALSADTQAAVMPWALRSGGTPVRVRAVRCRARVRCQGLRTGVRCLRVRRAGSAAWRWSRA